MKTISDREMVKEYFRSKRGKIWTANATFIIHRDGYVTVKPDANQGDVFDIHIDEVYEWYNKEE